MNAADSISTDAAQAIAGNSLSDAVMIAFVRARPLASGARHIRQDRRRVLMMRLDKWAHQKTEKASHLKYSSDLRHVKDHHLLLQSG